MKRIKTLADLKRIKPGSKLRLVHSLLGRCNKERSVSQVGSNGMWVNDPIACRSSWLLFPKASQFRADENGFTILENGEVAAQYIYDEEVED